MPGTDAERSRRHRRHRKGDHSLCDPTRCDRAVGFGLRGQRLWRDMDGEQLEPPRRVLLEEACRIADRLDRLDRLLAGDIDTWLRLQISLHDDQVAEVVFAVDRLLAEARQQAVALKQIVTELRQGGGAAKPQTGGDVLDDLAARRARRHADASG